MKKLLAILALILLFPVALFAACWTGPGNKWLDFGPNGTTTIETALNDCTPDGAITTKSSAPLWWGSTKGWVDISSDPGNYTIDWGVKNRIKNLTYQLMIVGGVLAVGGIVVSAILMTTALGDDKKLWEAKNGLKYSIIGFLCIIIAFPLVNAIINLVYDWIIWNK
jgi:hypothetical protein